MALKQYIVGGFTFQYEEGEQPAGAVEVKSEKAETKARTTANKARATRNKTAQK